MHEKRILIELKEKHISKAKKDLLNLEKWGEDKLNQCIFHLPYHEPSIKKNSVEVRLTEEFCRKNLVFCVSLVKPYHQTGEDRFPSREKSYTPQDIVEVEEFLVPVNKIIKDRNTRLNEKDHRQYWVSLKNQTADKDKWFSENSVPDGYLHLRGSRASRTPEKSDH
ncbi:hypothetical protein O181_012529 [Austropuccinia psidii MF-1]|uniref:Uncharacterized protein n=1 Tax=Austropuccinia psidii MF-1 TaxID=1389203 RepID=A0A9Q3BUS9_9BASI|nr:hypothetical protein [Austropuccinia psidii MF-1]